MSEAMERLRQLREENHNWIEQQLRHQQLRDDPFETPREYRSRILQESRYTVQVSNLDREYLEQIFQRDNIDFFCRQGYTINDANAYLSVVAAYGLAQAKEDQIMPVNHEATMQVRNLEPFDFNRRRYSFVHDDTPPLESWNFHIPDDDIERAHVEGTGGYTPTHEIEMDLDRRIINAVVIIYGMENLGEGSGVYPVGHLMYMAGNIRVIDIYDTEDFYYTKGSLCVSPILVKRHDTVQVRFKLAKPLPADFSIKFRGLIFKRKQDEHRPTGAPI